MRARLIELHRQRARLAARAEAEREQIAGLLARADTALAWLARVRGVLDEARRRPLLLGAAALLVLAWRPRRALKLLASGWSLWRLYQRALRWWARVAPPVRDSSVRGT